MLSYLATQTDYVKLLHAAQDKYHLKMEIKLKLCINVVLLVSFNVVQIKLPFSAVSSASKNL